MAVGLAAKRYAQAAFQLALERDALDGWAADLGQASETLATPEVLAFLQHAKVPYDRKVGTIAEALPNVDALVRNLLSLMVTRGLIDRIPEVEREYRLLLDQHRGRVQVEVTSAVALDDEERQRITRLLERLVRQQVELATQVDPDILGGLVLRIEDKLIDGSTRAKLNGLRRNLAGETG